MIEVQDKQNKADKKMDEMQTQMKQLKSDLIESLSKLIKEELGQKQA